MTSVVAKPAPPANLFRGASLFLDFDGTLVEFAERPDAVIVDDRLRHLLVAIDRALSGRVAIVSGRPLAQIDGLLGLAGLAVSGSHGAETIRADGGRLSAEAPAWLASTISRLETFSRDRPGVLVETKPYGVALHFRQAPDAERACHAFAESLAYSNDIHVLKGKMVVELRVPGVDKGTAIQAFMAERPMAGGRPMVLGDDVTDEAAFVAAVALGGAGILVGEDRPSAARYRLPDVAATLDWLETAVEAAA